MDLTTEVHARFDEVNPLTDLRVQISCFTISYNRTYSSGAQDHIVSLVLYDDDELLSHVHFEYDSQPKAMTAFILMKAANKIT